jgi:hypothetical protein
MTEPSIIGCAGWLNDDEYERCRAIAWRFVLAQINGRYGSGSEFNDLWNAAQDDIRNGDEVARVLEVFSDTISMAMVEKYGYDNALRKVKEEITKTDD